MTMSNQHQRPQQPYQQPYAGFQQQPPRPPKKKSSVWTWILATLGAIVGAFIVLGIIAVATDQVPTSSTDTPASETAQAAATPAAPAGPARSMSDGVYQVGVDVQAGRYKTPGPPQDAAIPNCYWQRASNDSGEFSAVIANGNIAGPGSVTVKRGEFVQLSGGCEWTKVG